MPLRRVKSISRKLTIIVMVISGIAVLISSTAMVLFDIWSARNNVRRNLDALVKIVSDQASAALEKGDRAAAVRTLTALRVSPNLRQACLYGPDAVLFARYAAAEGPVACPQPVLSDTARLIGRTSFIMFRSISDHGAKVGTLYFDYSLAPAIRRQNVYVTSVLLILLSSMLLALALSFRLGKWISGPVGALTDTVNSVIRNKDYFLRAEVQTSDELRALTQAFNEMLDNVQRRDLDLRLAQEELERRVRERTAELRLSEQSLRAVAQTANDPIISADSRGTIVHWNSGAERSFGYTAEEATGRSIGLIIPKGHETEYWKAMRRYLRTRKTHVTGTTIPMTGRRKDGTNFPLELSLAHWRTGEGVFFTGIVRDVTERRRGEEALKRQAAELERSNAELRQFAYVASHDLQEPLRVVTTFVRLLADRFEGKPDAEAEQFIFYALDGTARMSQLIKDLLQYSRVSAAPREMSSTNVELVLQDVLLNLDVTIRESGVVVTHDPLPTLLLDRSRTLQLLQNLIGNAIKFRADEQATVHVSAKRRGREWLFSVRDNGIGIDPDSQERIFVLFQRLHDRTEYPGTGIGLAICKKIVERLGGRIWVDSAPGRGSTFYFTIPAAATESRKDGARDSAATRMAS